MLDDNVVDAAWRKALANELRNNMLIDTPLGKTAFASGVACVLELFERECDMDGSDVETWIRIRDDARAFVEDYMTDAAR